MTLTPPVRRLINDTWGKISSVPAGATGLSSKGEVHSLPRDTYARAAGIPNPQRAADPVAQAAARNTRHDEANGKSSAPATYRRELRALQRDIDNAINERLGVQKSLEQRLVRLQSSRGQVAETVAALLGKAHGPRPLSPALAAEVAQIDQAVGQCRIDVAALRNMRNLLLRLCGASKQEALWPQRAEELAAATWQQIANLPLPTGASKSAMATCERLLDELAAKQLVPSAPDTTLQAAKEVPLARATEYQRLVRQLHREVGDAIETLRGAISKAEARRAYLENPQRLLPKLIRTAKGAPPPAAPPMTPARAEELAELKQTLERCRSALSPLDEVGRALTRLRGERFLDGLEGVVQINTTVVHSQTDLPLGGGASADWVVAPRIRFTARDAASGRRSIAPALNTMGLLGLSLASEALPVGGNLVFFPRANLKRGGLGGGYGVLLGPSIPGVGRIAFLYLDDDMDGRLAGIMITKEEGGLFKKAGTFYLTLFGRPDAQGGARGIDLGGAPVREPGLGIMLGHTTGKYVAPVVDPFLDAVQAGVRALARRARKAGKISDDLYRKIRGTHGQPQEIAPKDGSNASERRLLEKNQRRQDKKDER